ncbi:MAG: hypothetical protein WC455_02185 [Dehalococcoidia bacterium]|jgi:hypothetical protein
MKTTFRIGIFILALFVTALSTIACEGTTSSGVKKITLADDSTVLNMSTELPASFERLDADSEGMSNNDLGLGSDFTEVTLFLSEDPYQMVFAYYCIIESRTEQAGSDAVMQDEEQIKSIVISGLQAGAAEGGGEFDEVTVDVIYPSVGELAVLGSGTMSTYGMNIGYDILMFKVNKVYVFICSVYLPGEKTSLVPLGTGIEQRIGTFSQ